MGQSLRSVQSVPRARAVAYLPKLAAALTELTERCPTCGPNVCASASESQRACASLRTVCLCRMGHAFRAHAQKQHVKPRAHTGERTDEDSGEVRGHLQGALCFWRLPLSLSSLFLPARLFRGLARFDFGPAFLRVWRNPERRTARHRKAG